MNISANKKTPRYLIYLSLFFVILALGIFGYRLYGQKNINLPGIFDQKKDNALPTNDSGVRVLPEPTIKAKTPVDKPGSQPPAGLCDKGFVYSQKTCQCVPDSFGCAGLEKNACEKRKGCYSFNRSGNCGCPECEIFLSHQCLPEE